MKTTRRSFIKRSATLAGVAAVPYIYTSEQAVAQDANSRPTVAAIGVGGSRGRYSRGGKVARDAAAHADMIAVCDCDSVHCDEFSDKYFKGKLRKYIDYRELFDKEKPDVVTIGTNDHWHVPIAVAAMHAGCDVYCEKPLTLTIDEGKIIERVVKKTGRVFQVGTQQRSEYGNRFLRAIAMVQSGRLGDNVNAYIAIGNPPTKGGFKPQPIPEGLNWDLWLGPAREAPYMEERRRFFRWFFEYSGGKMTDWGAHHIDIAMWALGMDKTGPTMVNPLAGKFPSMVPEGFDFAAYFAGDADLPHTYNTAYDFSIDLNFASGQTINVNGSYKSEDGKTSFGNGILFVGSKGRIFVNRGRLSGAPVEALTAADNAELDAAIDKLYKGKPRQGHMRNFFDCLADRSLPVSDVFTHHRTMTSCHLCNIALMLGRKLEWDPVAENFGSDAAANALASRPQREKYRTIE